MSELELIVKRFAGRQGRFLDVGAFDGATNSLTRELWACGWRGALVEPNPSNFARLLDLYGGDPTVELVHAAVAPVGGLREFWGQRGGGELSSLSRRHVKAFSPANIFQRYLVAAVSPAELLAALGGPAGFRFLSLDVEGLSPELFSAFPLAEMPDLELVCIEHDGCIQAVTDRAATFGFAPMLETPINLVLERAEVGPADKQETIVTGHKLEIGETP